jgi:hypothetical protein
VVAIAVTVYCPDAYISPATRTLWAVMTDGRPPWRPRAPGGGQSGGCAFADEVAFELGQGGEHVEDELAAGGGGGGVNRLLEAAEADAAVGQTGDGVDQVPEGAAEAVELPDDERVAGTQLVQDLGEGGAVGAGTAGGLDKHPIAAGGLQRVDLKLGLLVGGGDPGIAKEMSHGATVSQPSDTSDCTTLISDTGSEHR